MTQSRPNKWEWDWVSLWGALRRLVKHGWTTIGHLLYLGQTVPFKLTIFLHVQQNKWCGKKCTTNFITHATHRFSTWRSNKTRRAYISIWKSKSVPTESGLVYTAERPSLFYFLVCNTCPTLTWERHTANDPLVVRTLLRFWISSVQLEGGGGVLILMVSQSSHHTFRVLWRMSVIMNITPLFRS